VVERRDDVRDIGLRLKLVAEVGERGREEAAADLRGARVHEHALAREELEVRAVEDLLGLPRVSVGIRVRLELLRADDVPRDDGGKGDRDPAEGRRLPVRGAPGRGRCASGEIPDSGAASARYDTC
jgi:hypothetical protein